MVRGRVAAHYQDYICVANIDPVIRHCTASERLSQSRYSSGVSDPRLVFYIHQAPGPEHLLEHIAFLVVQGRAAHMGDRVGPVYDKVLLDLFFGAVRLFFLYLGFRRELEALVAGRP